MKQIVSKTILQQATRSIQLCVGQIAGIEAAKHATSIRFSLPDTEGVLLVDASNAFNFLPLIHKLNYIDSSKYGMLTMPLPLADYLS